MRNPSNLQLVSEVKAVLKTMPFKFTFCPKFFVVMHFNWQKILGAENPGSRAGSVIYHLCELGQFIYSLGLNILKCNMEIIPSISKRTTEKLNRIMYMECLKL